MENNRWDILILFLLFLGIPLICYTFYSGNNGNLYGYYLTGFYLPIILGISLIVARFWKLTIFLIVIFLFFNLKQTTYKFNNPDQINFSNQLKAVEWIKNDGGNEKFNIDVYVPPVIPYSYEYLFKWMDIKQDENKVSLLYTLYEIDSPHPERLVVWLERQKRIGKVMEKVQFGGITVERRERILYE
ncbi:MAG: hypothetical protein UR39_C0001G0070 [Candidatus Woesebacteria bacterium GW2011_GWA1_33_30]|uniref:Uncharacterized protein n=1 Tax=Candidatus Woesebacteria bacterium GW2011_GWA2_33_28 TaxID=1618561 RepID=A0A0G0CAR6_9BACT|nr:MAG: hypothetical protein UR38_C0001G0071 [Candidatus Woesebacteria bacterium GW2011_GWA2_33_28]KKP49037.1 MAG: hypothetical protein UR39_C0001G0070 [Candidatus Woesebacteria bacterium GW2011_GWA1_33_30]KKP49855.1 MAG: hypothetical protein UR40_C0003G0027 [Microgenomates group bacterium GW2011_GWC1_33_32]KKP52629.1 MAG: hypothetical protein UR44_C0001G0071 [Candidatus Woesebacteria bacterium GW2011_GWB1_33_38]KKP58806.1 MAG: hypothetical protein UR48_C0001G0010 [Microgenomates group bacteriu